MTHTRQPQPHYVRRAILVLSTLLFLPAPARANYSVFTNTGSICTLASTCWQAGEFGVLVGLGTAVSTTGTLTINGTAAVTFNGDVGVTKGSKLSDTSTTATSWNGIVDFADPLTASSCKGNTCTVPAGDALTNVTVAHGTKEKDLVLSNAASQALAISNYYAPGCIGGTASCYTGSRTTISGKDLMHDKNGITSLGTVGMGVQVFDTDGASIATNKSLTLHGGANDLIIINILLSQGNTATFSNSILLGNSRGDSLTSDQVLFNYIASPTMKIAGGTDNATFLVRNAAYEITGTTVIDGRLLGGSGALSWAGTGTVNDPPDTIGAPEPATWALLGGALLAIGRLRKRRS